MLTDSDSKKFDNGVEWLGKFLLQHQHQMPHGILREYQALLTKAQIVKAWVKKQTEQKEKRP